MAGVTVPVGSGHFATTTANGYYTITNVLSGSYIIAPTLSGYSFSPVTRSVTVPPDAAGQDFTLTQTFTTSGRVTSGSGAAMPGVTIWAGSDLSATTNATGYYVFGNLLAGTYVLTPTYYGYTFSPITHIVTGPPDATEQDFAVSYRVYLALIQR
jgi:hypothetical protein